MHLSQENCTLFNCQTLSMHKEFYLELEAFGYNNIVIYQYNAIKGRSCSISELHTLSPIQPCSIFHSHICVCVRVCVARFLSSKSRYNALFVLSSASRWITQLTEIREIHLISFHFISATWKCSVFSFLFLLFWNATQYAFIHLPMHNGHPLTVGYRQRYWFYAQI